MLAVTEQPCTVRELSSPASAPAPSRALAGEGGIGTSAGRVRDIGRTTVVSATAEAPGSSVIQ